MRRFSVLLLGGLLSGCLTFTESSVSITEGVDQRPEIYCSAALAEKAKVADWSKASIVEEYVKDGRYQEGLLEMWENKPYIIRLTNQDDTSRSFRSRDFFWKAGVYKVVQDDKSEIVSCMDAVTVGPGKTTDIYVLPQKTGTYYYYEAFVDAPYLQSLFWTSDMGMIYVR